MERINVTKEFRLSKTNCGFHMTFTSNADTNKAYQAMKKAITDINYENGYAPLWLQDLDDNRTESGFDIESTLCCDEFCEYIPAMLKAVAAALPTSSFNGNARYDALNCYWIDDYEFSFNKRALRIKETFMDDECGYFCPKCGGFVAYAGEDFSSDEIVCDECEATIKVAELVFVPPRENEETIQF